MATRSPDYAHALRRVHPFTHAPITPPVHAEGQTWCTLVRNARMTRERMVLDLTCEACGFVDWSDGASSAAVGHDNLCCGMLSAHECAWPGECLTHADPLVVALMAVV